jgi:hypothetical protein
VKIKAAIKVGLIAATIAIICFWVSPLFIRPVGTTTPEAIAIINELGGAEKISKESEAILDRFGTNGTWLSPSSLADFQSVSNLVLKLGSYSDAVIFRDSPWSAGFPAHLRIRFGSHFHCHFLYLLDSRKPFDAMNITNGGPNWIQVASNIFIKN